ncbi:hypothetical protein FQN54_002560 [Arachnomyces sp. PD_36]|nr:hypothetical protein FQN54_002560 [Arachnomyces sp. PD_36]
MKFARSQEGSNRSTERLMEQEKPCFQHRSAYFNRGDGSSGHSNEPKHRGRNAGNITVEDISGRDTGYDADVEIVNPYLYEDADSDSNTPSSNPPKTKIDFDDLWKRDIVDSMKSLDCNSERDDARLPVKRGVKRKPRDAAEKLKNNDSPASRGSPFEVVEIDDSGFSPKKPRRSKRLEAQDDLAHSAATAPSDEGSSAQPLSTEASRSSSEPGDAMDIDSSNR